MAAIDYFNREPVVHTGPISSTRRPDIDFEFENAGQKSAARGDCSTFASRSHGRRRRASLLRRNANRHAAPVKNITKRTPDVFEGEERDTDIVVPRLSEYERERVDEAKALSAEGLGKAAAEIGAKHDRTLAEQISAKTGMPIVSARRSIAARHRGVPLPFLDLDFDHLGIVSVAAVLADPERSVGDNFADPMEGADYGRCKAKERRGDDGPFIRQLCHGRLFICSGTMRGQVKP